MARDNDDHPTSRRRDDQQGMNPLVMVALGFVPVLLIGGVLAAWLVSRSTDRVPAKAEVAKDTKPAAVPSAPAAPPAEETIHPAAIAGLWERPDADDGAPYMIALRADGSASLYSLPDPTMQKEDALSESHGSLVVLDSIRRGKPFLAEFRLASQPNSSRYTMWYDGRDELRVQSPATPERPESEPVTLRRTGPPPALPVESPPPTAQTSTSPPATSPAPVVAASTPPPAAAPVEEWILGTPGTVWSRPRSGDGMPTTIIINGSGRIHVVNQQPNGIRSGRTITFTAIDPPVRGKWFRAEFGGSPAMTYQINLDGNRLFLAPSTSTTPAKDSAQLILTRVGRPNTPTQPAAEAVGTPATSSAPPSPDGFGKPGTPAGPVAGVWERMPGKEPYPLRFEIRPDGSARFHDTRPTTVNGVLQDFPFVQACSIRLDTPAKKPAEIGTWYGMLFSFEKSTLYYQIRLDSKDQLSIQRSKGGTITYTRSDKPVP